MKYYIVCTDARSGTNFLRRLMSGCDAGTPWEIMVHIEEKDHMPLKELYNLGTLKNAWGVSLHLGGWYPFINYLKEISGLTNTDAFELLNHLFPGIKFIYLHRINKIKQAISKIKAEQSGVNSIPTPRSKEGFTQFEYSKEEIQHVILKSSEIDARWLNCFEKYHITPHKLSYEGLCEETEKSIIDIMNFLGIPLEDAMKKKISDVKSKGRQYDAHSKEWYQRFLKE